MFDCQRHWPIFRLISWDFRMDLPDTSKVKTFLQTVIAQMPENAPEVHTECRPVAIAMAPLSGKSIYVEASFLLLTLCPSCIRDATKGSWLHVHTAVLLTDPGLEHSIPSILSTHEILVLHEWRD